MNMSNVNEKENNDFEAKVLKLSEFDLDKSSMIEASAGTGKTFTISNLVVRLLLEGIQRGNTKEPLDIENLLIVTFTNAAAADLRARVLEKIHECRIEFDLIKNGGKPILLGLCCWISITAVSLLVQSLTGIYSSNI